jgi:purine-binding chemotaxis protein CheW
MNDRNIPVSSEEAAKKELQLVTFYIGREEYCVEVLNVREIIRMPQITKMPNAPSYVSGIINLRGKVIPIVSIRERFNFENTEHTSSSRIIVMDSSAGSLIGFIVDSVSEVIRIKQSEVQPPPAVAVASIEMQYITGIINSKDSMRIFLDLGSMFSDEEKSALIA